MTARSFGAAVALAAGLSSALLCASCEFVRSPQAPIPTWLASTGAESPARCLIVLLPGVGDRALEAHERGWMRDVRESRLGCDVALVDAHFAYYREQNLVERVRRDVLEVARQRGYETLWLVGISLGSYGACLIAREHPELVDGVVLIAPLLGLPNRTDEVVADIRAAGGLQAWDRSSSSIAEPEHHFREPRIVWTWLRDVITQRTAGPEIVLAYGRGDRFRWKHDVLGAALGTDRVVQIEGGHDWVTWRALWRTLLRRVAWNAPASDRPASDAQSVIAAAEAAAQDRGPRAFVERTDASRSVFVKDR